MDAWIKALAAVPGVKRVTRGWPKDFQSLPCVAVTDGAEEPLEYADDTPYITRYTYYVYVYDKTYPGCDKIARAVVAAAEVHGLLLTEFRDDEEENIRVKELVFETTN